MFNDSNKVPPAMPKKAPREPRAVKPLPMSDGSKFILKKYNQIQEALKKDGAQAVQNGSVVEDGGIGGPD